MVLLLSLWLRWWARFTFGEQWSTPIRDDPDTARHHWRLIRTGPYAYWRHPIHLAAMPEVVAIRAVASAYFTLLFVVFSNIPIQFMSSRLDEQTLLPRLGSAYTGYLKEVCGFLPFPRRS